MQGASFRDISIPTNASWGWKGILDLRSFALPHINFFIGNGQITSFWTNPSLNGGRLKDPYGERAIYALGMGVDIRVSSFLQNNGWHLPRPTSNALKDIFQAIPSEIVPWPMFDNEIVWTLEE